jgi:hypothetical protein
VFPARRRISFVRERRDGLLASGALRFRIRILGPPAATRGKLAVLARLARTTGITAVLITGVLVRCPVPPAVSEGAESLVLIGRPGGALRAVQLGRSLAGVVLLRIPVPVGVSLVRIGLAGAFLVVRLLVGLVTVLRPRITARALRTREDLVPPETLGGLKTLAFIPLEALATLLGVSVTAVSLLRPGHLALVILALALVILALALVILALALVILALALVIRTLIILLGISAVVVSTTGIRPAVLTWAGVRTADALTGIRPAV